MKVSIYELRITNYELRNESDDSGIKTQDSTIKVLCSAGTYIRTLAEDIGRRLNVGAHLAELRRTKAGKFDLSKAVTLEELETMVAENRLSDVLVSMNEAVSHLPFVTLNETETKDTQHGKRLRVEMSELADNENVRMIDAAENLLAIGAYRREEKSVQPKLVLI